MDGARAITLTFGRFPYPGLFTFSHTFFFQLSPQMGAFSLFLLIFSLVAIRPGINKLL
jgi:hypothetical protein